MIDVTVNLCKCDEPSFELFFTAYCEFSSSVVIFCLYISHFKTF